MITIESQLRYMIRRIIAESYFKNSTGEFIGPGKPYNRQTDEEAWLSRVASGKLDRHKHSGPIQDDIDDTESYLDDIEYEPAGETGALMYGAEDPQYDPMCDADDEMCDYAEDMADWEGDDYEDDADWEYEEPGIR